MRLLSFKYYEIFKNTHVLEHIQMTASDRTAFILPRVLGYSFKKIVPVQLDEANKFHVDD